MVRCPKKNCWSTDTIGSEKCKKPGADRGHFVNGAGNECAIACIDAYRAYRKGKVMSRESLKLGDLTVKRPIIQGGMGVGISLGGLAGAVAGEGGVGIISAAQIGFGEKDFDTDPLAANLRAIKKEFDKARQIAPEGVVGFNIMVAMQHYGDYVQAAADAGADIIISGAGLPTELPKLVGNAPVKLAPIVSTERSASVILKYWDRKYDRVPDLVVIEGPLAGGHLGFTREQLAEYPADRPECYEEELGKIFAVVRSYEERFRKKIPIAIAGGIENREQAKRAFEMGADAIQVATRFVTTFECDADIRYKETYLRAGKGDIMIVKSPVGMPGRAINNTFMKKVNAGEKIPRGICHGCLKNCKPAEIPYCITDALIHAAKGEVEDALLFCGAYAYRAGKLETVKEVIDSLLVSVKL